MKSLAGDAPGMRFLHCERCGETVRVAGDDPATPAFHAVHRACGVATYLPTGRAVADGPWWDPMVTRRIEVCGDDGRALAVGRRTLLDEPLAWRLERRASEEEVAVELDRDLFWAVVDRALHPNHVPTRAVEEWATRIDRAARRASPSDIVLLEDDPSSGDATFACFTVTARARLEADLRAFGLDAPTEERLSSLFDEEIFPPLRVRRRLVGVDDSGPALHPRP